MLSYTIVCTSSVVIWLEFLLQFESCLMKPSAIQNISCIDPATADSRWKKSWDGRILLKVPVCRTGCRACLQQDNCNSNQIDTSSVCFNIALLSPAQNSKALTACEKGGLWREGATLVEDMQQKVVVPNQLSHWDETDQAVLRVATHALVKRVCRIICR